MTGVCAWPRCGCVRLSPWRLRVRIVLTCILPYHWERLKRRFLHSNSQ
jgi:hypothetical protein